MSEKEFDRVTEVGRWRGSASLVGRVLAERWTILEPLGVGGTGTVYEARHRNGRRVAVKVLHPQLADHPLARGRFSSEGYAANRVRHPGAVAVLDDGEEADGTVFLVMELLEGQSLADRLSEKGPLPVAEVVSAAISVLDVLAAAHDHGVIHRDVKPANIFLTTEGRIKLLDFGVARVAELATGSAVTQNGTTVGTPAFMAPEQAAGRTAEVDALTDIWAVGATMFQLFSQRLVHDIASSEGAVVAAATRPAPEVRSCAPDIPSAVARIVDRALAFQRSARWPNARAMQSALLSACPELAISTVAEPSSLETEAEGKATQARAPDRRARSRWLLAFLSLLSASLIFVMGWSPVAAALRRSPAARDGEIPEAIAQVVLVPPLTSVAAAPSASVAAPLSSSPPRSVARALSRATLLSAPPRVVASATAGARPPAQVPLSDEALLDRRK